MAIEMRHMIIVLPGLMGSVLEKQGIGPVWSLSGQALWQFIRTLGASLQSLRVAQDDWQQDDLDDGIVATRIIQDIHSVPFLVEHAGYAPLLRRIPQFFDVTPGSIDSPQEDANFYVFYYDWRRDCRATARKLKRFIDTQLPRWRNWSGAADAQVILIGHSLGGLVSRHYLEAMEGWRSTRALFTIGSPHRGAVGALNVLSNGFRVPLLDLSGVLRSFGSAYQILPTYPAVKIGGQFVRVSETDLIPNVDRARAQAAREDFLIATHNAAIANRADPAYHQRTFPWVGTRQDTLQSAEVEDGRLVASFAPPPGVDAGKVLGDGTVVRVSAVPADLEDANVARFAIERHGWLTNNETTLEPLLETIAEIATPGTQNLLGGEVRAGRPAINLRLDPMYAAGEPVVIRARIEGTARIEAVPITLTSQPVNQPGGAVTTHTVWCNEAEPRDVVLENLSPGLYEVTAGPAAFSPRAPDAVHGVFEIAEAVD